MPSHKRTPGGSFFAPNVGGQSRVTLIEGPDQGQGESRQPAVELTVHCGPAVICPPHMFCPHFSLLSSLLSPHFPPHSPLTLLSLVLLPISKYLPMCIRADKTYW